MVIRSRAGFNYPCENERRAMQLDIKEISFARKERDAN